MRQRQQVLSPPPPHIGLTRVYAYYRLLLSALLLGMFLFELTSAPYGSALPDLFLLTAVTYTALNTLFLIYLLSTAFRCERYMLFFNLLVDIVALNLLMFASGGTESGIGLLLLATVAIGTLFFSHQVALLLAAFACILVVGGALIGVGMFASKNSTLFPAGMLGVLLFFTALLFRSLNRRLLDSETVATREADQAAHLQRLNELIVNRMRTGIILVDASSTIRLINSAAVEHLGGHRPGAPLGIGLSLKSVPAIYKLYERWRAYPWLRCPPVTVGNPGLEIQCNFARLEDQDSEHTLLFIEDTRSTAQNAQQLKLASLGRMAGSIAHEIRNPLGAISHAAQLLREQETTTPASQQLTDIINRHSERVNDIVDSIMQLSRQQPPAFQKLLLDVYLKRFVQEYSDAHPAGSVIELALPKQPLAVLFDPVHLNQILTNLVENAHRHSNEQTGSAWARLHCHRDGKTELIYLDIEDRGAGIESAHLSQIFEPFFTTSHTGTGLGLYLARERCEINYATLNYCTDDNARGLFRISFAHPEQLLPGSTNVETHRANR